MGSTGNGGLVDGAAAAQQVRLVVRDLWGTVGLDDKVDRHALLYRLSQDMERLARLLEAGGH
ncbi:MAG TPA: hypothetical protein VE991_02740 [Acidimicrobiales bacterium]|nr:hypothetical protein [Acidimicrobiales bacterium]